MFIFSISQLALERGVVESQVKSLLLAFTVKYLKNLKSPYTAHKKVLKHMQIKVNLNLSHIAISYGLITQVAKLCMEISRDS